MKKIIITLCFLVSSTFSFTAWALDLDTARSSGLVGERLDGYIGAVSFSPSPDVLALVKDINNKRHAHYAEISKNNGQPLKVVEELAAQKVLSILKPGEYYMTPQGSWAQK